MLRTSLSLLLSLSTLYLPASIAAVDTQARIEQNTAQSMQAISQVPGIGVAIYAEDFVLAKGFGVTSVNTREAASADTAFYIASSTKSITALAMANLHEKGVLNLDDSIASFSPDAPFPTHIETDKITLRQLLSQSSGIKNNPIAHRVAFTGDHTPTQLWNALAFTENNEKQPRGSFRYSNYNFNVLTVMTDKELNRSWKDILAEDIFDKAGMTKTTAYVSKANKQGWSMARPHQFGANGVKQLALEKKDNTMQSAGGILMSANDAAIWLELLVEQGKVDGKQIVPANAVLATQQAESNVDKTFLGYNREYYGLGFYGGAYGDNDDLMLHHFGSFAGSSAHISYLPQKKMGVAIFANDDGLGIRLATILSNYIYRELDKVPHAADRLHTEIEQLAQQIQKHKARLETAAAEHAKRQYQLSLPMKRYTGIYSSERFGDITIRSVDMDKSQQHLEFTSGNLSTVSTPYPKDDAVRIEAVPGSANIMLFNLDNDNQVESLTISGDVYTKVTGL